MGPSQSSGGGGGGEIRKSSLLQVRERTRERKGGLGKGESERRRGI